MDVHGVTVTERVSNCWILENDLYHNSGDGVQINARQADQATTHHIYVGRNTAHENKQTGFWTKQAVDVIFSENTAYTHYPIGASPSAWGAGMGYQYGPERVWFLNNHVFDCAYGIQAMGTSGLGTGQNSFFIGNLIHDIRHDPGYAYEPQSAWSNAALMLVGTPIRWIVNNTLYNVDGGIYGPSSGEYHMANNIIASVAPEGRHVFIEDGDAAASSRIMNTLFDSEPRISWGTPEILDLESVEIEFPGAAFACRAEAPLLNDPPSFDFHLQDASPAIDRGTDPPVYAMFESLYGIDILADFDSAPRPRGRWLDIGADEGTAHDVFTDVDADGDVDHADWDIMDNCLRGVTGGLGAGCAAADFDEDEDVDMVDFAEFQVDFAGSPDDPPGGGIG